MLSPCLHRSDEIILASSWSWYCAIAYWKVLPLITGSTAITDNVHTARLLILFWFFLGNEQFWNTHLKSRNFHHHRISRKQALIDFKSDKMINTNTYTPRFLYLSKYYSNSSSYRCVTAGPEHEVTAKSSVSTSESSAVLMHTKGALIHMSKRPPLLRQETDEYSFIYKPTGLEGDKQWYSFPWLSLKWH